MRCSMKHAPAMRPCAPRWAALMMCGNDLRVTDAIPYGEYCALATDCPSAGLDARIVDQLLTAATNGPGREKIEESILRAAQCVGAMLRRHGWSVDRGGRLE